MKEGRIMLSCNIVKELLPLYQKKQTSYETEGEIGEHLQHCPDCQNAKDTLVAQEMDKKAPKKRLELFKNLKRKQKIGAALSTGITLLCMYGLYNTEYCVDVLNTASLEAAVDEQFDHYGFEADFTESINLGGTLLVQFRNASENSEIKQAVLQLDRGLFFKYRIRSAMRSDWALYTNMIERVGLKQYLVISGVNDPVGANTFRLYLNDEPLHYPNGSAEINLNDEPIYEGKTSSQVFIVKEVSEEEAEGLTWPFRIRYYDQNGAELDKAEIAAHYGFDGSMRQGGGTGQGPTTLYVYLTIVLVLGIILVRYFIMP